MNDWRRVGYSKRHCPSCGIIIGIDGPESLIPEGEKICIWCIHRLEYIRIHHPEVIPVVEELELA